MNEAEKYKVSYEEFEEMVKNGITVFLPDSYKNANVQIKTVEKLGATYRSLLVTREGDDSSPAVNLTGIYDEWDGKRLADLLRNIADIITTNHIEVDVSIFKNYEKVKDKLFIRVSGYSENEKVLSQLPHKVMHDLALTYHIIVKGTEGFTGSLAINNELLKSYGIDLETLHRDALASSERLMPFTIRNMAEILGYAEPGSTSDGLPLMVLTNADAYYGASVFCYPHCLDETKKIIGGNFYMLPSSVHEWVVVPEFAADDIEFLRQMVCAINAEEVAPIDRLADSVYFYDGVMKKVA